MRERLHILISAGPTREPIDPVRFISNYSTGYMGAQLAAEALARGHRVTVVSGPIAEPLPAGAKVIPVGETREMERALRREIHRADVLIMAAAVSDFRLIRPRGAKLPRRARLTLTLEATPDILARLPRRDDQLVVGFALETNHVVSRAAQKLRTKRLDLLLAQHLRLGSGLRPERRRRTQQANGTGSPFGRRRVRAWLLSRNASPQGNRQKRAIVVTQLGAVSKPRLARVLLDKIEALWYGQTRVSES